MKAICKTSGFSAAGLHDSGVMTGALQNALSPCNNQVSAGREVDRVRAEAVESGGSGGW